jgi:hypothetical protein
VDRVQAEIVLRQALRTSAAFEWSAAHFRSVAGEERWPDYRSAVEQIISGFYAEIMRPIEQRCPELAPLIYENRLFAETEFPAAPESKSDLAAQVRKFLSAVLNCTQRSEGMLSVSAPRVVRAAERASAILSPGT